MESKVKVIIRVRPFLDTEDKETRYIDIKNNVLELTTALQKARYSFDVCYGQDSQQQQIFNEVESSIGDLFGGINTTVFAYGMTGAGKTHTMQGSQDQPGLIPRVAKRIVEKYEERKNAGEEYDVMVSYLEIYNEKVYDLLEPKDEDLPIRQAGGEIIIPGLSAKKITSYQAFNQTYQLGCKNRTTATTGLNHNSSRSHAILSIVTQIKQHDKLITGKMHLIDLAGSEDNRYTNNIGIRMTESSNINTSLFVLGKVVTALNEGCPRIAYRDSKLTRLLQDSLGGKSNAIMIANISPSQQFFSETQRTLNFAAKSRKIINKPVVHTEVIKNSDDAAEERKRKLEEWRKQKGKSKGGAPAASGPSSSSSKESNNQNAAEQPAAAALKQMLSSKAMAQIPPDKIDEILAKMSSFLLSGEGAAGIDARLMKIEQALLDKENEISVKSNSNTFLTTTTTSDSTKLPMPELGQLNNLSNSVPSLNLLTPSTKEQTAKGFLLAGKEQERRGQLINALALYENAYRLLPEKNSRLATKIKKLKEKTKDFDTPPAVKEKDENEIDPNSPEVIARTAQVLNILNTGSVDELSKLHMIAAKRANLIIKYRPFKSVHDLQKIRGFGEKFTTNFYILNIKPDN